MNNLKILRIQAGLTQSGLASVLGVTQGAVAHYERGIRRLSIDGTKKILEVLNTQGVTCKFEDVFPSDASDKA